MRPVKPSRKALPIEVTRAAASVPRWTPVVVLGVGVLAVSTASVFVRMAQQSGAPSLAIAALRLTLASLILLPWCWRRCRGEFRHLSRREWLVATACGGLLGLHFATWISSLQFTTVTSSVVLVTVAPLFVAFGSALFLREKLSRQVWTGILLAVAGGLLIGLSDASGAPADSAPRPLLGNSLALAGALSIAAYFLIGRGLRLKLSLLAFISLAYGFAAVALLACALITRTPLAGYDPPAYAWIALLALIPQLVGHTSFNWALGHLSTTYATIPALGEPVGSTLLAIAILGETVSPAKALGGALTLAGLLIMSVRLNRAGAGSAE